MGTCAQEDPAQVSATMKKVLSLLIVLVATTYAEVGKVGRLYGAKRTPEMFVINKDGLLVYQGAIDDKKTPDPADIPGAKHFVAAALDDVLAGKPVGTPKTEAYGCSVKYGELPG